MKDEKRQTRLLPFRLRRADATRSNALKRAARADAEDFEMDAELRTLLREWDVPRPSHDARARLLADFRASSVRRPLWRRALTSRLHVPVPVAACAVVALLAALVVASARTTTTTRVAAVESSDAATNLAPVVKIVEVPVVQERVVTRIVYIEKKERDDERGVFERAAARERVTDGARASKRGAVARDDGSPTSFFTRVDMADFQPADEMKIRIVKKGRSDEK